MVLRDIISPVSESYFLAGLDGVLCNHFITGLYFQKFNSMNEVCQLLCESKSNAISESQLSELYLFPSIELLQRFLASGLTQSLPIFNQIRASKAFSVSSVVSLTKKSYEAFKEMHHGRDLLLYSPSIVASSFDLQYVLVNESTNQILLSSPKLYMADIKNTFASPWVFPCGADINAARSARESLMCYCSSQFCAELEPCQLYLRIRETVIKPISN